MLDQTATIEAFLTATAQRHPTPGGGAVTALAGALATALAEMVLNYSIGKKDLAEHQSELQEVLAELTRARHLLCGLMAEDQEAYAAFSAARKTVEGPAALRRCMSIPQAVAATALAVLDLCDRAQGKANKHLLSDLAISADLAMAAIRCSIHSVRVNLADLPDVGERERIEAANQQMLSRALQTIIRFSRRSL